LDDKIRDTYRILMLIMNWERYVGKSLDPLQDVQSLACAE
jgi:hypothetical protein